MIENNGGSNPKGDQEKMSETLYETLSASFEEHFETPFNGSVFFCPGRVNLIGEHIDYNGGHVLPIALDLGIYGLVEAREAFRIRFHSTAFSSGITIPLDEREARVSEPDDWGAYPEGVVRELSNEFALAGCDVLFHSTLPIGSGLSSSAALEVLTAFLLLEQADRSMERPDLARLCQRVENEFIGVNCGVMDQFSVTLGKKDHALLLNCKNEEYAHVPFSLDRHRLVVMDTNKQRALRDSTYNQRREECQEALDHLQQHTSIEYLCDASLEEIEDHVSDPVLQRRARHVVKEQRRVLQACVALFDKEWNMFGTLLNDSHRSLRDDYEVTGEELDTITEAARHHEGCPAARMSGAGFGGCAIALVEAGEVDSFKEQVGDRYQDEVGLSPDFYVCGAADGVRRLQRP